MKYLTTFIDLVAWSTSSLRHRNELPEVIVNLYVEALFVFRIKSSCLICQRKRFSRNDKYPHIVNVETARTTSPEEVPIKAKVNRGKNIDMEGC